MSGMTDDLSTRFGANVRLLREKRGMPQTELAALMKSRGFAFHQQTIQRIEAGERPVRLDEASELAMIFGRGLQEMLRNDAVTAAFEAAREVGRQEARISEAFDEYLDSRIELASALDAVPEGEFDGHLALMGEWLEKTPEQVLRDVRRARAEEHGPRPANAPVNQGWFRKLDEIELKEHRGLD